MAQKTPKIFPKQTFANLTAAVHPIIQFLTQNHATIDGPGWHIIEAYDGTDREVPSDPTDLDSFTGGFGWRNDVASIPVSSWIVLESVRAGGNQFQVYFELDNTTTFHVLLITDGNWTPGAGTDTNPTIPNKCLGSSAGAFATSVTGSIDLTGFTSSADYTVIADPGVAVFLFDTGSAADWTYVGEIDQPRPEDTRPYIVWRDDSNVTFNPNTQSQMTCVDPLNGQFSAADAMHLSSTRSTSDTIFMDDPSTDFLSVRKIMPVGVHQKSGPSAGTKGWLRHVWSGENNAGAGPSTLAGRSFAGRNEANDTSGQVVFTWDRTTA